MKPLSELTLGEVKQKCAETEDCQTCAFRNKSGLCVLDWYSPKNWTLDKPTFTDREKEVLRYLQETNKVEYLLRKENGAVLVSLDRPVKGEECWLCSPYYIAMPHNWFPGLPQDTVVSISEVTSGDD